MNQVVLDRGQLSQFADGMDGQKVDAIVDGFQSTSSKGWSLLNLVSGMSALDPSEKPSMLGLDDMLARVSRLWDQIENQDASLGDERSGIAGEPLHEFDRRLLDTLARYLSEKNGKIDPNTPPLTEQEQAGLKLLYEQLLGEEFTPLLARTRVTTAASAAVAAVAPTEQAPFKGSGAAAAAVSPEAQRARDTESPEERRQRFLTALAKR